MQTRLLAPQSPVMRRLPLLLLLVLLPLLLLAWVQWQNEKRLPQGNGQLLSPTSLDGRPLPLRFPPHNVPQRLDWDFVLPEQAPQPWSLLLQHRPGVQVWLNGQLIAQSLSAVRLALPDNRLVLGGEWLLVPLPPQLLETPGPQRLSIQLGHAGPSGARLGGLWVGPSQAVQALDSARQHWQLLRSGTAFAALVVACFLALVAGVRLKERLYGMSALLLALLALLLSPYVLPIQPLPSPYWRMLLDGVDLLAKALQLAIVAQALGLRLPWRWLAPVLLLTLGWDAWAAWNNLSWGDFSAPWPWNALGVRALLLLAAPLLAWIVFVRRGGARAAGLALMSGMSLACWTWVNAGALVWPGHWTVVDTNALAHAGWVLGLGALLAHHFVGSARRERALRAELELELQRQKETLAAQYQALQRSERAQAAAGERERLLQDMHDGLGNQLLTLRLLVEAGEIDPEALSKALDACLLEMRLAVDALGDDDGDLPLLLASLRHRLQPALRASGLELDWQVQSLPPLLALEGRGALELMRWLQEVFSNVLRHAQAERMLVRAELAEVDGRRGILLLLADNGVGMAVGASGGRGQRNLRERAARLGAQYVCRSPRREASPEGGGPGTEHALWWPLVEDTPPL